MLVWSSRSATGRIVRLWAVVVFSCAVPLVWYLYLTLRGTPLPHGSDPLPLSLGVLAGAIIAFEMLIGVRKKYRGRRLGATKWWTRWHIWLGIACLPLGILHSGFWWGGSLTTILLLLLIVVVLSGVWGVTLQQGLPGKLLQDFPNETIISEVPALMKTFEAEIDGHLEVLRKLLLPIDALKPYLIDGKRRLPYDDDERCRSFFEDLKSSVPANEPEMIASANRLETMCGWRREWVRQARVYFWLHNWLIVHLPLSLALFLLLIVHAVFALKIW